MEGKRHGRSEQGKGKRTQRRGWSGEGKKREGSIIGRLGQQT